MNRLFKTVFCMVCLVYTQALLEGDMKSLGGQR